MLTKVLVAVAAAILITGALLVLGARRRRIPAILTRLLRRLSRGRLVLGVPPLVQGPHHSPPDPLGWMQHPRSLTPPDLFPPAPPSLGHSAPPRPGISTPTNPVQAMPQRQRSSTPRGWADQVTPDEGVDPPLRIDGPAHRAEDPARGAGTPVVRGRCLGSGGQGRVYELPQDPGRVLKEFTLPIPYAEPAFGQIITQGWAVKDRLRSSRIVLSWPEETVMADSMLAGYLMPRIDQRFYFSAGRSAKSFARDLQFAISRPTAFPLPFAVSEGDRLNLARLVGQFLDAMHHNGLVYGDLSWMNFTFNLEHGVELCVHDFDSTRVLGENPFAQVPQVDTPDWNDPGRGQNKVATLDSDRYKFALLVHRMLISHDFHSSLDDRPVPASSPLTRKQGRDVVALRERAKGPGGTRPQVAEWLNVLGD